MGPLWAITPAKVESVIKIIIKECNPRKIILFGSYVNGKLHRNSDLDVLVITDNAIDNPRKESVRIRRALKDIIISMDIIAVPESQLEELIHIPGLIYKEAVNNGKVVYEAA